MKSHTERITLTVPKRMDFVNITGRVEDAVVKSGIREGLCLVNAKEIAHLSGLRRMDDLV